MTARLPAALLGVFAGCAGPQRPPPEIVHRPSPGWLPDAPEPRVAAIRAQGRTAPAIGLLDRLIFRYQQGPSKTGGDRCPYFPSCSAYTRLALHRHGFWPGAVIAFERLFLRRGDPEGHFLVDAGGKPLIYDPVPEAAP